MPLSVNLQMRLEAMHSRAYDLATPSGSHLLSHVLNLANGVLAGQADLCFSDRRTLGAGANENIDLAGGVLTDIFGEALTFARVKLLAMLAATANPNSMTIGRGATNGVPIWSAVSSGNFVRPGGLVLLTAQEAAGFVVTASTADLINVIAGAGADHIYDIVIIGAST